jgi:GNAT superfamily N-acetyltransferase
MIEPLTAAQLPELEPGAREFYASSTVLRYLDPARFIEIWTAFLRSGNAAIFASRDDAEEKPGMITGAIGGILHPDLYDGSRTIADEFFWFARPEHRGAGVALYRAFEAWARERGASEIQMCHLIDSMPAKVARFYAGAGFRAVEVRYSKELRNGAQDA